MMSWVSMLPGTSAVRARAARAFKATLLIHAVNSLCAAALVVPVALSVPETPLPEQPAVGALYTAVRIFDVLSSSPLRYGGIPAFALLVVTPFLQVLWLRAQLLRGALHEHARAAADAYKQACLVYVCGALFAALLTNVAFLSFRGGALLLAGTHNVRLQQSVGLLFASPFALAALVYAPSLLDRAQLALAQGHTLSRARLQDVVRSVDLRVSTVRAAFLLASAALVLLSFLPRLWLGTNPGSSTTMFVIAQLAAAARTLTRAAWLAWLCDHVEVRAPVPRAGDIEHGEGTVTTAQSRT